MDISDTSVSKDTLGYGTPLSCGDVGRFITVVLQQDVQLEGYCYSIDFKARCFFLVKKISDGQWDLVIIFEHGIKSLSKSENCNLDLLQEFQRHYVQSRQSSKVSPTYLPPNI
eukprot:TRINITY_DN6068_c0_g1_i5.p1 TRINITY_DN6068_c0_g1~~TRINITY_DN6068_c0_g1_i5.p1  ORF type:complete len:113 (+),score=15.92 TRINITY_DN6068_c0_g1_i5:64-402(+)